MDKKLADSLEERERQLRESISDYEKAAESAKKIATLTKKQDSLQKDISTYLNTSRPDAGTIKRLTAGLSALQPIDAIYKANEGESNKFAQNFIKTYIKDIRDNLNTVVTGKDYTLGQKTYKDILTKQMGMKDGKLATGLGMIGDIAIDPTSFGAMKPVFKTVGKLGSFSADMISKIPQIEKGIDVLKSNFNIFYEIEKTFPKSSVDKFKSAFTVAVESKDFSKLANLGFDVSKYTKKGFSPDLQKPIPNQFNKILEEAFGAQKESGTVGKTLDFTSDWYKRIMSWSPKFQTRNFMGALTQGVSEGVGVGDYWKSFKMIRGKENIPEAFAKSGVMSQSGMFEQTMSRIPAKVASFGESLNRAALAIADMRKGKTIEEAIEHTQEVFYKYGDAYKTKFEKTVVGRVLPFYSFFKGQVEYWPKALSEKAAYWSGLGKITRDTETDDEKNYPYLKPGYRKDQLSIGSVGNFGFQIEDFLKNATGDVKNLWGQIQPVLKMTAEGLTDWKVFSDKSISGDKDAGQYKNIPVFNNLLGYSETSNTVNPWRKWALESMIGPILDPIKNLFDPKKPIWSVLTSVRDYDLSTTKMSAQAEMNRRQDQSGGFWNFSNRFRIGTPNAGATPPESSVGTWNYKFVQDWAQQKNISPDTFGKQYMMGGGGDQTMFFNASQNLGRIIADALKYATTDLGVNAKLSLEQNLGNIKARAKFENWSDDALQKATSLEVAKYNMTRPRLIGESTALQPGDFKYRAMVGTDPFQQFYNKAATERVQFSSKTGDVFKVSADKSAEAIQRGLQADIAAVKMQMSTQYGGISKDMADKRILALTMQADKAMKELEAKGHTAIANILENMADAEISTIEKIEIQRHAAKEKYQGSDDYKLAKASEDYDQIKTAELMIDAKYDKLKRDELVKQAKAHMEYVKSVTSGEAENIILTLKGIYERGGMSIKDFYGQQLATKTTQSTQIAIGSIGIAESLIPAAENQSSLEELNVLKGILSDPKIDPKTSIETITAVLEILTKKIKGIDAEGLNVALKGLSEAAQEIEKSKIGTDNNIAKDEENLKKAISELSEYGANLRKKTFAATSTTSLGIRAFSGASTRYGTVTSPYAPAGYDAHAEELKANLSAADEQQSQMFTKATAMPADIGFSFSLKKDSETSREYMQRMEQELAQHENNKATLTDQGRAKLEAIKQLFVDSEINRNGIIEQSDTKLLQQRLQTYSDMGSMMLQTAQMIFDATGKQSKEAFYAMKALAIVEATIKGAQAVLNAYESGSKISPVVGSMYAALAMAFVGTQVGVITSQMVNGPEGKKEGGLITKGSGTKDDVPIVVMKDEFVMRQSAVRKYGPSFMEALNKGLIPINSMNFSIPETPSNNHYQTHFAEGGSVSAGATPITVQLKNESGTPLKQTKSETSFNGQETIVSIWIDALERNVGGLNDLLRG